MNHRLDGSHRIALRRIACAALIIMGICLVGYATRLRAQNETKVYATSDDAAKAFIALITNEERGVYDCYDYYRGYYGYSVSDRELFSALISSDSAKRLQPDGVDELLRQMIVVAHQPVWETNAETSQDGTSVTVQVKPVLSVTREVVCVREGEGWRVDLVATYAKWFKLNEQQLNHFIVDDREVRRRATCQNNMKQIALGILQYTQDYDELYPPAKNWQDVIMPYVKSEQIFNCPSVESGKYGYAYNWKLSKYSEEKVNDPAQMILLYETTNLKRNASGEGKDMAFRHLSGTNIGFVDGHIKWFTGNRERKWPVHFTFQPNEMAIAPAPMNSRVQNQ